MAKTKTQSTSSFTSKSSTSCDRHAKNGNRKK